MAFDFQRVNKLGIDLLRVTAPGDTPDDNFRPSQWTDRIYWIARNANLPGLENHNYSTPGLLAKSIAQSSARDSAWFLPLEEAVATALKERGM